MLIYYQNTAFDHTWRIRDFCGQFYDLSNVTAKCFWRRSTDSSEVILTLDCVLDEEKSLIHAQSSALALEAGGYYLQCLLIDAEDVSHIVASIPFIVLTCPEVV